MLDIKLKIYEKLISSKDWQDVNYYIKILENTIIDLKRLDKGRNGKGRTKGESLEEFHQDKFEDSQTKYGLNGTGVAVKTLENRFGKKTVTTQNTEEI